ncbi:MAG: hypothetical protein PCFJNLEI_00097 [Verrucomicrobiae bacterium]|nr:hypothetical protein [Verrucomicrobiae bacterium]
MSSKKSPAVLHIVVYSNFEGFCMGADRAQQCVEGFELLTDRCPQVVWTHMFNPIHLIGSGAKRECGAVFVPYLQKLRARQPRTDIGLHTHLFDSFIEALGLTPRAEPRGTTGENGGGYDVLLTGYPQTEQAVIIGNSVAAFAEHDLARPVTFCAGYSATNPAIQAFLEKCGFTTSFAGQVIPPGIPEISHHPCWYELLEWGENITPLTRPYRVQRDSILPGPGPYLDRLVEVPLVADQDIRQLYLHRQPVSRQNLLDFHAELVRVTGRSSCVPLGVHDCFLERNDMRAPVTAEMVACLEHVERIAARGAVTVRYSTAAEVSQSVFAEPELW